MLEELGIEEASAALTLPAQTATVSAGLAHRLAELEAPAADDLRHLVVDPLLYGSLKEVGLAVLSEITAFEFISSGWRDVSPRRLPPLWFRPPSLAWFTHHSEVDIQHAEQGLDNLVRYIRYYEFNERTP